MSFRDFLGQEAEKLSRLLAAQLESLLQGDGVLFVERSNELFDMASLSHMT